MVWLSTWYLNKPIYYHKPEGLGARARQYLLSRHTPQHRMVQMSSYSSSKSFLSSSIVSSGPVTECPIVLGSS